MQPAIRHPAARGFAPRQISAMTNRDVLAVHVSEAAFLWRHRERAARAPHYDLMHLDRLDERLQAHLQALHMAGDTGARLADEAVAEGEPAALFVAAWLAGARADAAALARLAALAGADTGHAVALAAALCWLTAAPSSGLLRDLLAAPAALHRAIGLRVLLERRAQPRGALGRYLGDAAAPVRALAAGLAGSLKRHQDVPALLALLHDPDAGVQLAAARALALLGEEEGPAALLRCMRAAPAAPAAPATARTAVPLLACSLADATARDGIQTLARDVASLRAGIRLAGLFGDTRCVDWLLALMEDPAHARLAGEAFANMTGADLDPLTLRRDPPPGHDADTDPLADEDGELGWPDPPKIQDWWLRHRSAMPPGQRYLCGRPVSAAQAHHVLRHGLQRQRAQAAVELARLDTVAMEFPVHARAAWQRRRLSP